MILTSAIAMLALVQAAVWKPYTLGDGFVVSLPSKPDVEKDEEDPKSLTWTSFHDQGTVLQVSSFPADRKTDVDIMIGDYIGGMVIGGGSPVKIRDIVTNGWPGSEFLFKFKEGGLMFGRIYATDKMVYTMTAMDETEKAVTPVAQKMFASFKLPKAVVKGPLTKAGPTLQPFVITPDLTISMPREAIKEIIPLPNSKDKLTSERFISKFANVSYVVVSVEMPDSAVEEIENASQAAVAGQLNDELIKGLEGKSTGLKSYKIGEVEVISQTVSIRNRTGWARIDSFRKGKRMYSVVMAMLTAAKNDKEVEEFFKSISLGG